jgi:hypothetical protein
MKLTNSGLQCHGTGTSTGDPIETTAVGNVFGERGVYIGSVSPMISYISPDLLIRIGQTERRPLGRRLWFI